MNNAFDSVIFNSVYENKVKINNLLEYLDSVNVNSVYEIKAKINNL